MSVENGRRSADDAGTIGYPQERRLDVFLTESTQKYVFKYVNIKNNTNIFRKYICLCPSNSVSRIRKFAHVFKKRYRMFIIDGNNKKLETILCSSDHMYESWKHSI